MKKLILSAAITSLFSLSAFAAEGPAVGTSDTTDASIQWVADIPVVVPGEFITFTGANGAPQPTDGVLDIKADGTFSSTPVSLELHYYDDETSTIEGGVVVGDENEADSGVQAESITYTVNEVQFMSEQGVDMSGIDSIIMMGGTEIQPDLATVLTDADAWKSEWSIQNKMNSNIPSVVAGDTVTATTVVYADVSFAAM